MKLIPNARAVLLQSYSQRAQMVALAIVGGYGALPERMQDALPEWAVVAATCTALVLGIVGRLIEQPKLKEPEDGRTE